MKSLAIVIAILFLGFSGMATFNETVKKQLIHQAEHIDIEFSHLIMEDGIINIKKCANLLADNKPIIPVYTKTYVLPAGSKFFIKIKPVEIKNLGNIHLQSSYIPAPPGYEIKEGKYNEDIIYPEKWYSYETMGGIKDGKHVVILVLHLYPVRYVAGNLMLADKFELKIEYELPSKPLFTKDEYDLLIICPEEWMDELQLLKEHKEGRGIKTIVVSLNEIYNGKLFYYTRKR